MDRTDVISRFRLAMNQLAHWSAVVAVASVPVSKPLFNLAVLREERGDFDGAVRLYEGAIERSATHFQARFNLGRLLGSRGNVERQRELWAAALEANPDFARGYFMLAKLVMDTGGDLGQAEGLAREGLARDPDNVAGPLGFYVLADILNRQGRRAEAELAARQGRQIEGR